MLNSPPLRLLLLRSAALASAAATLALPLSALAADEGWLRTPDQFVWTPGDKPTQALPVHGDAVRHVVTRRVRIAPGTDLPPHTHERGYRLVTVISGTLLLGFGERFDEAGLKPLPPGSVFSEPAGHKHYARTLQDPVVLQLTEVLSEADARAGQSGKAATPAHGEAK